MKKNGSVVLDEPLDPIWVWIGSEHLKTQFALVVRVAGEAVLVRFSQVASEENVQDQRVGYSLQTTSSVYDALRLDG
jgi:hypothetical protein